MDSLNLSKNHFDKLINEYHLKSKYAKNRENKKIAIHTLFNLVEANNLSNLGIPKNFNRLNFVAHFNNLNLAFEPFKNHIFEFADFYHNLSKFESLISVPDLSKNYSRYKVAKIAHDFYNFYDPDLSFIFNSYFSNFSKYHNFSDFYSPTLSGYCYTLFDKKEIHSVSYYDGSIDSASTLVHEFAHRIEGDLLEDGFTLYSNRISNEFFPYFINLCFIEYLATFHDVNDANFLLRDFHEHFIFSYNCLVEAIRCINVSLNSCNNFTFLFDVHNSQKLDLLSIIDATNIDVSSVLDLVSIKYALHMFDLYLANPQLAVQEIREYLMSNLKSNEEVINFINNHGWLNNNLDNYKRILYKGF